MNAVVTTAVLLIVAAVGVAWVVSGLALFLLLGRVIRNGDRQIPHGWHRHDPACGCAGCERGEPSSPYVKIPQDER